ncbi:hypothetical protein [Actinoplanes sp. NPDC049265]|uniref:hypothetical protein n=1 Tax=Actinoplanes sp. NPDC049265 TaxID=3363902 RepID=UPI00372033E2
MRVWLPPAYTGPATGFDVVADAAGLVSTATPVGGGVLVDVPTVAFGSAPAPR